MGTAEEIVTRTHLRHRILGVEQEVPLLDGRMVRYVNFDNAASTPPLVDVMDALTRFLPFYSSVHRGTGFKSRLSTGAYDDAHRILTRFVGADPATNTVIFGKNSTEAVNKLSYRFPLDSDAVVISSQLEHHSNDLPWRRTARVVHVGALPDGRLDEDDFDRQLAHYGSRVALVSVTGASNVSGLMPPIHRLARKAHAVGVPILVDAAQLAPHRRVDMKPDDDPEHLDFVVLSAHKMYAPFGTGALIGPKDLFLQSPPEYQGGGTVDVVTLDEVFWADVPDREEAGSPNVVGAVAMAAAAAALMEFGMDAIAEHESRLVAYCLEQFREMPGVLVYGDQDPDRAHTRVGAIPLNLEGVPHSLLASILGHEGGIGVRHGCFCAHPYVVHLLQLSEEDAASWRTHALKGDKSNMPGMVRVSFGCYNTTEEIDRLVDMLSRISRGEYQGRYRQQAGNGEYVPDGDPIPFDDYFSLDPGATRSGGLPERPCGG